MPTRPARAPRRIPMRFIGFCCFPHGEITRITLSLRDSVTGRQHVINLLTTQRSIGSIRADIKVNVTGLRISVIRINNFLHHLDHFRDVAGSSWFRRWSQTTECGISLCESSLVLKSNYPIGDIIVAGIVDYFVVNIGNISNKGHVVPLCT